MNDRNTISGSIAARSDSISAAGSAGRKNRSSGPVTNEGYRPRIVSIIGGFARDSMPSRCCSTASDALPNGTTCSRCAASTEISVTVSSKTATSTGTSTAGSACSIFTAILGSLGAAKSMETASHTSESTSPGVFADISTEEKSSSDGRAVVRRPSAIGSGAEGHGLPLGTAGGTGFSATTAGFSSIFFVILFRMEITRSFFAFSSAAGETGGTCSA
ncbi:MAG: hypothetical protein BWY66_01301 [bacterium ADurb.Bin374]|nr:MAG: hypothetical protein BWY66_01301 [bacterium ADurb.Bin374]